MSARMPGHETARSEAARWFVLRQSGDMSVEDARRFRAWLGRSIENHQAFARAERAWMAAGAVANEPEIQAIRDEALAAPARRGGYWPKLAIAASFLLVVLAGALLFTTNMFRPDSAAVVSQTFQTAHGQRTEVALADGSVISLDTDSRIVVRQTPDLRHMDLLKGRAFFRVAKNPHRPFIVEAGGKSVRAIGTAFEVNLNGGDVTVTLTEGKVSVADTTRGEEAKVDMTAGRQLVARADRSWALYRVDTSKETSWTTGQLTYMNDPLSRVVADVNRYSSRKVRFEGGQIPNRQIVGVFQLGDVDGLVKALKMNGIAQVVAERDGEIVLSNDAMRPARNPVERSGPAGVPGNR